MLQVCGHRVLLKAIIEEVSKGGIVIAQDERMAKVASEVGIVVDVGPEAWKAHQKLFGGDKPWAEKGDRVLYSKYGGKMIRDPDTSEEFIIINDEDIMCKVT